MHPILLQTSDYAIYSYPLLMGIAWGVGYEVFLHLFLKEHHKKIANIIFWGVFLSAWIGSKILFLLTSPHSSEEIALNYSFWTGGGFVFYGGLIGGGLYLLILNKLRSDLNLSDYYSIVPALTLGHAIGRLGCFLAGCCFGAETNSFLGIHLHGVSRFPTQLIESIFLFFLTAYLLKSKKNKRSLIGIYFISYGIFRFFLEYIRADQIRGFWMILSPSQWISIIMLIIGFWFILKKQRVKQKA